MKRRVIKRVERREQPVREEFYEAMPATTAEPVYREGPVYRDEPGEERLLSGWAILGLIVLALVILLLLFGRSSLTPAVNRSTTNGTSAPVTNQPVTTPATR